MSDSAYLTLMLDAPMMSWGVSSRFQRRTTELHPSRSAVCGMICAAMGRDKGSEEEAQTLQRMETLTFAFYATPRAHPSRDGVLAVRRLEDYHTVSGTRSADNPRPKKDAVLTYRQYLLDARFVAILTGEAELLTAIASALSNPRWGIWLGRKSCIPAAPVAPHAVRKSFEDALADAGLSSESSSRLSCVLDAPSFAEGTDTLMDIPVNFSTREFKPRRIERKKARKV